MLKELGQKIKQKILAYVYLFAGRLLPIDENKVLFFTFQGTYTCNPKYICEELHKKKPLVSCVWVSLKDKQEDIFPSYVKVIKYGTREYYRALYTSKVWIDNAFNIPRQPIKKREKQYYIETMHGSLGIKRIGPDVNADRKRNKKGFQCGRMSDYLISNSEFENQVYRTSFWPTTPILKLGHARNDLLVSKGSEKEKSLREKVRNFYHINLDSKLALYAPTFLREHGEDYERLDPGNLRKSLEERFGGKWYILYRFHPRDVRNGVKYEKEDFVLDGNSYVDIQEMMVAIDFGITDYSSWIYDYILTGNIGLLYTPDIHQYENSTGFYYPISSTPFSITRSNNEVKSAIESFDTEMYAQNVADFIAEKGCVDDGKASKRAAEVVIRLLHSEM